MSCRRASETRPPGHAVEPGKAVSLVSGAAAFVQTSAPGLRP